MLFACTARRQLSWTGRMYALVDAEMHLYTQITTLNGCPLEGHPKLTMSTVYLARLHGGVQRAGLVAQPAHQGSERHGARVACSRIRRAALCGALVQLPQLPVELIVQRLRNATFLGQKRRPVRDQEAQTTCRAVP